MISVIGITTWLYDLIYMKWRLLSAKADTQHVPRFSLRSIRASYIIIVIVMKVSLRDEVLNV